MNTDDPGLLGVIRAIADGTHVDWDAASHQASDSFKRTLAELRVVAEVANLHRSLSGSTDSASSTPTSPRRRQSPTTATIGHWGHLHLVEHVASGSFGDVYRAWDPAIDREVALKLLRPAREPDTLREHSIEEGRLLARVRHPNVVTIYGAARVEGRVGIWMEFVHGRTLSAIVQQDGPLPSGRLLEIAESLCRAVSAVHEAGLLHRDIKAQNVMLSADGRIVLMDFGAGHDLADDTRDMAGTPLYLAPEVLAGGPPTIRADLYSLGVLLTYLATARLPTAPRISSSETAGSSATGRHRAEYEGIGLKGVLQRAMAATPGDRFATVEELGAALRVLARPQKRETSWQLVILAAVLVVSLTVMLSILLRDVAAAGSSGSDARRAIAPASGLGAGESLRKLDWRAMPTGAPSRDGRFVGAVNWDSATGTGLPTLIDLVTGATRTVWRPPDVEAKWAPYSLSSAISPDSTRIAFSWYEPGPEEASELKVCPFECAAPRVLLRRSHVELRAVGWSAGGTDVLVLVVGAAARSDLVWVSMATGQSQHVMTLPGYPYMSLNQNGRDLALDWPQAESPGKRRLMLADMVTGELRPLLEESANDAMPVWLPDGRRILFASDRGGAFGAWVLDLATDHQEPQQVRGSMGYWQPIGFGSRGELYYVAQTGTVDVYTAKVDLEGRSVGPRSAVATSFSGRNIFSDWAPDGRRLAFTSRRGAINFAPSSQFVVIRDLRSKDERVLATPFSSIGPIRWAPDGRRLAVPAVGPNATGLFTIDSAGDGINFIGPATEMVTHIEWLSNDVLLFSQPASGAMGLYRVSMADREPVRVRADFQSFSLSRARDRLAFLRRENNDIVISVAPVEEPQSAAPIFRGTARDRVQLAGWSSDDLFVVAVRSTADASGQNVQIVAIPVDGGEPLDLGESALGRDARTVGLNPQGTMLSFESGSPSLTTWVLEHPALEQ